MKKLLFCFIILLIVLTGCPTGTDECQRFVGPGYRDALPFLLDIVIENKTSEDIEVKIARWTDRVTHGISETDLVLSWTYSFPEKNLKIEAGKENEIDNYVLIDNSALEVFVRGFMPGVQYQEKDYTTIFPGCFYLGLFVVGERQYSYMDPYYEASRKTSLFEKDVFDLTVADFVGVGGDLYYVFDPDGTTSFGQLVSSVPSLKEKDSGHVKVKYTITDDPENEGKRFVEFSYLGEVTDSE